MDDGFVLDHSGKVLALIPEQGKRLIHTDTWRSGPDDDAGATRKEPTKC